MKQISAPGSDNDFSQRELQANLSLDEFDAPGQGEAPGGGLLEYWRILQRRKGTVSLVACLGLLGGILYTLPQTPIFQARAVIEVQGVNEDFLAMKNVNPNAGTSGYDPTIELQTQVQIMQSGAMLDRVRKKLLENRRPFTAVSNRLDAWRRVLHLPVKEKTGQRAAAIGAAASNLAVHVQTNTRLIEIRSDSTNPQVAADFVNTLATEFIEQSLEARWKTTQHTGEWLARQMQDMKVKLEKSEEAMQAYARSTNLVITDEKQDAASEKLKQLQEELSKAQSERIARQSRYELANHASVGSLAEVLDDVSLKDIQTKLTDLHRQSAELTSALTPANPKVVKVQAQITALESALHQERLNILGRIRSDFESAERREKLLASDYAAIAHTVAAQADKVTHYNTLKREVDTNRQMYDSILQRVKEAGIASALRASNISVVDPALVPGGPYKPNMGKNVMMGLLLGFLLGVGAVVFLDRADRSVQEPGDLSFYLGVPELGIVPSSSADPTRRTGMMPFAGRGLLDSSRSMALVTGQTGPSAMAEAFRATLTSIMFSGTNGTPPQVLVVSSASPKEGKTTLTTNLAIALAEVHKRVLLIDGDMRRPSIHRLFDLVNDHGLVDLLRRREPIQTVNGFARPSGITNLSVMTTGRSIDGDPTLLHSTRLTELMQVARENYDVILFDTPPMLNMSDARVIARHSDGVILIARANRTSRDSIKDARRLFAEDRSRVIGAVLNDWNPKKSSRYSYYRYYEGYRQYYAAPKTENEAARDAA